MPANRTSQLVGELLRDGVSGSRTSQVIGELLRAGVSASRSSQLMVEVLQPAIASQRTSQLVVEMLVPPEPATLPAFPTGYRIIARVDLAPVTERDFGLIGRDVLTRPAVFAEAARQSSLFATVEPTGAPVLVGYAVAWGAPVDHDGEPLRFARGCFDDSLATRDVLVTLGHRAGLALGSQQSGVLELTPDAYGLRLAVRHPSVAVVGPSANGRVIVAVEADEPLRLELGGACVWVRIEARDRDAITRADLFAIGLVNEPHSEWSWVRPPTPAALATMARAQLAGLARNTNRFPIGTCF
jgi:hypothetical protein